MTAVRYIADYGRRLIPTLIDEYAREVPDKTYCFVARSSLIEDGFEAISYSKFADAISHCSLWMESELGRGRNFDTVAYLGPPDLRTTILIVATIKTGHKVTSFVSYFDSNLTHRFPPRSFLLHHETAFKRILNYCKARNATFS